MSCNGVNKMSETNLHPSVEQFKQFLKKNPKLVKEVRLEKKTWQQLYENWVLLGEEDEQWNDYKEESKSSSEIDKDDIVSQLFGYLKKVDVDQVQNQMNHFSQAIGAIQGVISQFQGSSSASSPKATPSKPSHPFGFRKD